ncbi:uncharacterized protein LOC127882080 isoform X2 [Dreissena polymorpha]|uniref:uncharacterized protein LOC127882080 isoform X2 n=1 Tax=Dreissena polymorpha TaxID=45954 RepID=UPI002263AE0F|nr:uncharacterized protein LOC127882080 isoform X2 [Dreissena polymorpha]
MECYEYISVMSFIKWNRMLHVVMMVVGLSIAKFVCYKLDFEEVPLRVVACVGLITETMQCSNYVLLLTLVGPANGLMAANTTIYFRVVASVDGLLTCINLALVITPVTYRRSRQRKSTLTQPITNMEQQPLALIRVEYEKAVRKDSKRAKLPTIMKIENISVWKTDCQYEFSQVLQQCWNEHAHLIGIGKDAKGLTHSYMDIQSIRPVDNQGALWKYSCRRQAICDFAASVGGLLKNIHEYKNECSRSHVIHTDTVFQEKCALVKEKLSNNVDKKINEYYLFHGTLSLNADYIAKNGFNVNECKTSSMLGRGIYFTDSLVKADQYTKPDESGMCCVIMARVLLGDFVVAPKSSDIPSTSLQPPCKECMTTLCNDKTDTPHPRFDSVVYTGGLYKEFVVYDNWQAYPEFIIFYKRV